MKHDINNLKDKIKRGKKWCWFHDKICTLIIIVVTQIAIASFIIWINK